jgi:hypothetical protein
MEGLAVGHTPFWLEFHVEAVDDCTFWHVQGADTYGRLCPFLAAFL